MAERSRPKKCHSTETRYPSLRNSVVLVVFTAFAVLLLLTTAQAAQEEKAGTPAVEEADNQSGEKAGDEAEKKEAGEEEEKESDSEGWILEGYARLGHRLRFTRRYSDATEEDQDARGILSLSLSDREKKPRFSLNLLGSFNLDTDGSPHGGSGPYRDVCDSYSGNFNAQIYSAYAEYRQEKCKLFVGRQAIYRGESLDFDGLRAECRLAQKLNVSVYGGIPSNFWESSHEGDHFAGGGLEFGVPKVFSVRGDYIHIRDKMTREPEEPVAKDNLLIFTGKYIRLKPLTIDCLYSSVNGEQRRALLRARWLDKKNGFILSASVLRQNVALARYSTELSPYYVILAEYAPYCRYRLMILKRLCDRLEVEVGADARRLLDKDDEGMLNHSYERYYGGFHLKKLLKGKIDFTIMVEQWNATGRSDRTAIEGLVKFKAGKNLTLRAGSDFSKYLYDYNFSDEKENVYSTFVRADYKLSRTAGVRLKYSFNRDDREDYNVIEAYLILNW